MTKSETPFDFKLVEGNLRKETGGNINIKRNIISNKQKSQKEKKVIFLCLSYLHAQMHKV